MTLMRRMRNLLLTYIIMFFQLKNVFKKKLKMSKRFKIIR